MHRSGTSSVTRAVNLLGVFLGDESKLAGRGVDNPEKFWEHADIVALQGRLLAQLNRRWDAAFPLPENWHLNMAIRPFRDELKKLISRDFAGQPIWAWKDPRSCLLMPLWRDILDELQIELSCVFVVRSPVDVKNSLAKRDQIPANKATGIWFNYSLTALNDTGGVRTVFVNYDQFLTSWETELRRVAAALNFDWPTDEKHLHATMSSFLRPNLRHHQSTEADLRNVAPPARKLYELLLEASAQSDARNEHFEKIVSELVVDFRAYADFFESELNLALKPPFVSRTLQRWKKSFRKRFSEKN